MSKSRFDVSKRRFDVSKHFFFDITNYALLKQAQPTDRGNMRPPKKTADFFHKPRTMESIFDLIDSTTTHSS